MVASCPQLEIRERKAAYSSPHFLILIGGGPSVCHSTHWVKIHVVFKFLVLQLCIVRQVVDPNDF